MDRRPTLLDTFIALKRAHDGHRLLLLVDPAVLNRPGSPVFSPIDVFVPPVVLLASSLTALFAFGLLEWIFALVLVLLYQCFLARHFVEWRMRRRTVRAALASPQNFMLLWGLGGLALALKDWPERNCFASAGDWQKFVADYFMDPAEQDGTVPEGR